MKDWEELWFRAQSDIYIGDDGEIIYDKRCERIWREAGADFDYLMTCIEDNCYEEEDPEDDTDPPDLIERIDWQLVERDFNHGQQKG